MKKLSADHPWQLFLGPAIWALWFVVVYGGVSVACATVPPAIERGAFTWVNGGLLLLTLATTLLLVLAALYCRRMARQIPSGPADARRRFVASAAAMLHVISAVSTAFVGIPLLVLSPCV